MLRVSEAVLPGHPDKICDQIVDYIIYSLSHIIPKPYVQLEASIWQNRIYLNGIICLEKKYEINFKEIVHEALSEIDPDLNFSKFKVDTKIKMIFSQPNPYTGFVGDQVVVTGWAGYDERTHFLPLEHFLVIYLKEEIIKNYNGILKGLGPDGKILALIDETKNSFEIKCVVISIQHKKEENYFDLYEKIQFVVKNSILKLKNQDERWSDKKMTIKVNPAGKFINGGGFGDNGQTGIKLTMDFYGPRIPIGGGALSGKSLWHIDRVAAYASRQQAVLALQEGSKEFFIRVTHAPSINKPIDIFYRCKGNKVKIQEEFFDYDKMIENYLNVNITRKIAEGLHFYDLSLPWNSNKL